MITTTLALVLTLAMSTLMMSNPISMAIAILFMALSIAILFAMFLSSWMAFLLFLIYIGGMLVMFAYFVATAPNSPLSMKPPILLSFITLTTTIILLNQINIIPSSFSYSTALNTFYSPSSLSMLVILAMILLLTMIVVVKLVSLPKGPLRSFNKSSYV